VFEFARDNCWVISEVCDHVFDGHNRQCTDNVLSTNQLNCIHQRLHGRPCQISMLFILDL